MAFGAIEAEGLGPWDAGLMRLRVALQVDSCVRQVARAARPDGELVVTLPISPTGKAPRAKVTGSTRPLRQVAACLQRVLRTRVTFVKAPAAYTWKATIRLGEVPSGISVAILRLESADLMDRAIFDSVFTMQLERAACVERALGPGLSVAINADLALVPGATGSAKVELSTHASADLVPCLEQALAGLALPATAIPAKVHVFFHLLQAAPATEDGDVPSMIIGGPSTP